MTRKRKEKAAAPAKRKPAVTPEPDFSPDSDYWPALGQFVEAFALAEGMLFMYLIHSVKVDKLVGKALFGRSRCGELIKDVRRTWDVAAPSAPVRNELDDVLSQLRFIDGIRNELVHNRSHVFPDRGRVSTNLLRAHTPFHVAERPVSPKLLYSLTTDLGRITVHLTSLRLYPDSSFEQRLRADPILGQEWLVKQESDRRRKPGGAKA